jgi:hypothetical protein
MRAHFRHMFQELSNDMRNFLVQWVLTLAIALWRFKSPLGLELPKWEFTWECGGFFLHTLLHSWEHEMWLPCSLLAHTFASPYLGHEPKARVASILVSIHIYSSLISMLISTSYYSTTCKLARPSHSIVWTYPPLTTKNTSPSHCNTSFICFFILLINIVVIFHKQKWFTCTIKILKIFFQF